MISSRTKYLALGAVLLPGTFLAGGAAAGAQGYVPPSAPVQPYREDPASALTRHLRDLNTSPRSLFSLLGAGQAALDVGDARAALTFFARAEEVAPRDGRVKAGMASAFVHTEQAAAALRFFAEAASLGIPALAYAKDRGLAYDMSGDQVRAQADYALALQRGSDPEVERRLALSKAISGDRAGALRLLDPQLRRHERGAWRAHAFVLALTGDAPGALQAFRSVMPLQASAMAPFLARLPQLSAPDRAMAVHFGRFPRGGQSYAGVQYPQGQPVQNQYVPAQPAQNRYVPPQPAQNQYSQNQLTAPTIAGRPDPRQPALGSRNSGAVAPNQVTRTYQPPPQAAPAPPVQAPPVVAQPQIGQPQIAQNSMAGPAPLSQPAAPPQPAPAVVQPQPQQQAAQTRAAPPAAAPAPAASSAADDFNRVIATVESLPSAPARQPEQKPVRLAEASRPAAPKPTAKPATPKADTAKPAASKAAEKKAEAPKPKEPSRIWVQIAIAQDKSAFPGEFKRLKTKAPELLAGKSAWTAPMGRTNRLLVGPFKTEKEAGDFVNQLSKEEISAFRWESDEGQKIDKLPAR